MAGPDRVTKRWPLVGRDAQLDRFADVLAAGGHAAFLVYGPPGVGKTRLAEECLAVAERADRPVARVVAGRVAADLPFGAIAHLLPSGLETDGDPGRLAEHVRRELRELAGDGRLVLLVDDIPLLDAFSLTLLTQLANAGALLLVATLRSGETTPEALASLWSGDGVARVDLTDLDRDGSDALLHEVLGGQVGIRALAEFWQAGRGNPLYLRELLWGAMHEGWLDDADGVWQLTGPLPSSPRLLELVGARIGAVGAEGRAVLERLALCQPLGLDELDATDHVMEAIEAAELVRVRPDRRRHIVTLGHPVYAQVIQGSMTRIRIRGTLVEQAGRFQAYGLRRREDALRVATWQLSATGTADPRLLLSAGRLARHTPTMPDWSGWPAARWPPRTASRRGCCWPRRCTRCAGSRRPTRCWPGRTGCRLRRGCGSGWSRCGRSRWFGGWGGRIRLLRRWMRGSGR